MLQDDKMPWYEIIYCRCYQARQSMQIAHMICREPKLLNDYEECVEILQQANRKRVLLITGPHIQSHGLLHTLEQKLFSAKISYAMFVRNEYEICVRDVEQARLLYETEKCSAIIAVGGGSVMNCAKLCAAELVKKKTVRTLSGVMRVKAELPFMITIPTTAGTGCEASMTAVAKSDKLKLKWLVHDVSLVPRYVCLDAQLTTSLPKEFTAYTGISALAQAIEVYIGVFGSKKSRAYAEKAVKGIFENIENAYMDGNDLKARKGMLVAAHYAGLAQTRTLPGYVYAMANAFSMQCKITHAMAQAILLPAILQAYGSKCYKRLGQLARTIGVTGEKTSAADAAQEFVNWIYDLCSRIGIPSCYQLSEIDIAYIASYTLHEANPVYPVPKIMGYAEIEMILRSISDGFIA